MEEFKVRRGLQRALFVDGELTEPQTIYLTQFAMPVCLPLLPSEVSDAVWEGFRGRPEWDELLANEEVRLYRFVPSHSHPPPPLTAGRHGALDGRGPGGGCPPDHPERTCPSQTPPP